MSIVIGLRIANTVVCTNVIGQESIYPYIYNPLCKVPFFDILGHCFDGRCIRCSLDLYIITSLSLY